MGPPDILYQGTEIYEIWNNIAIPNSYILGWEPWELSVVFNPDPSQLSLTKMSKGKLYLFCDINRTPRWPSTGSQSNPHVHLQLSSGLDINLSHKKRTFLKYFFQNYMIKITRISFVRHLYKKAMKRWNSMELCARVAWLPLKSDITDETNSTVAYNFRDSVAYNEWERKLYPRKVKRTNRIAKPNCEIIYGNRIDIVVSWLWFILWSHTF